MKYIAIILLFFSFKASAQVIYTPMSAGGYQMKYLKIDSGFALPFRDTALARNVDRPGLMVVNPPDSLPYYYNGRVWKPVYVDSSGIIKLIQGKVDSVTVNGNNLFYWVAGLGYGAQLNKLDSIHVSSDSIFTCIAGNCTFQYVTSAGTGTVTKIMAGFGLINDTITTTGTIAVDTSVFHTSNWNNAAYAPIVHFHAASDIISGTLPIVRGGTGMGGIGAVGQVIRVASGGTTLEYYTPPVNLSSFVNDVPFVRQSALDSMNLANGPPNISNRIISGGIVTYSGSGLTYYVSSATYVIGGTLYTSPDTTITLNAADATNPRIDLFAVDTLGRAVKITGTAASTPLTPQSDPASQLPLTTGITLAPGATTPSGTSSTLVYDENTEWTTGGTATTDYNNTAHPYHGSKDAYVSNYAKNSTLTFSGTTQSVNGQILRSFIYLVNANYSFQFRFYNGTTAVTNTLTLNGFGFNPTLYGSYQNVSIPLSSFTWSGSAFDKLVITMTGSGSHGTFYVDYISLENGTSVIPPATDYSNKVDNLVTRNDSLFYVIKGIYYYSGTKAGTGSGTVTSVAKGYGILADGTITTSGTVTVDSAALALTFKRKADSTNALMINGGKIDTSHIPSFTTVISHEGAGLRLVYGTNSDTIHSKNIQAGTGVTLTQNTDSSVSISATGTSGVASVTGNPTALVNNTDPANPVIQQDASKLDKSDSTIANRVTANTTNIAANTTAIAGKVNSSDTATMLSPYFKDFSVTTDTTVVFTRGNNTTKTLTITGGGTILNGTGYVKMSGSTPSYITQIPLTTDVTGILPFANGGLGFNSATNGDILFYNGGWQKLGIGTSRQRLAVVSGLPAWIDTTASTGASKLPYATVTCSAGTCTATVAGISSLDSGLAINAHFLNAPTISTTTLEINSLGAKNIQVKGVNISGPSDIGAGFDVYMVYDGIQWQLQAIKSTVLTSVSNTFTSTQNFNGGIGTNSLQVVGSITQGSPGYFGNLWVPSANQWGDLANNYYRISGRSVMGRFGLGGYPSSGPTPVTAGYDYANVVISSSNAAFASGTSALVSGLVAKAPDSASKGTAVITDEQAIYAGDAPVQGVNNWSVNQGRAKFRSGISYKRTAVADAAYTLTQDDFLVAYTSLTTTRAVTLPSASSYSGFTYIIKDESGTAGTNNITIVGTVDGVSNPTAVSTNYGKYTIYSNGTAWFTR